MNWVRYLAKAITAGTVTFFGGLVTAAADHGISAVEWYTIIPVTVVAIAGVFGISNGDKPEG